MLRINRQTDYAIRVILKLAQLPAGVRLSSSSIRQEMLIPPAFMGRIVAQLAQADLLLTFPGRDGGLQLPRPAAEITMKEVVEAMEGHLLLSECMTGQEACPFEGDCRVRCRWIKLQARIMDELKSTTFADLASESAGA
jgi:Rrf2 family protein